jgi:hypothetical protein
MTLSEIQEAILRMPLLTGKQASGYRCSQRTFKELCEKVQAGLSPRDGSLVFFGVRITVDPHMPDGKFYPEEYRLTTG